MSTALWWRLQQGAALAGGIVVAGVCTTAVCLYYNRSSSRRRAKVVVIGGGFAGVEACSQLQTKADVVLVDSKPYHEYTPDMPLIVGGNSSAKANAQILNQDLSERLPFTTVRLASSVEVRPQLNLVVCEDKDKKEILQYDYLVLATGSSYDPPFKRQDSSEANTLELRNSDLSAYQKRLKQSKGILVVGGGVVGVEVAAELACRPAARSQNIILVTGRKGLLPNESTSVQQYARRFFKTHEVSMIEGCRCHCQPQSMGKIWVCENSARQEIQVSTVIHCVGGKPNSAFLKGSGIPLDKGGFVKTDPATLCVQVFDGAVFDGTTGVDWTSENGSIFCVGDLRAKPSEFVLASFAHFEAEYISKQILRMIKGRRVSAYRPMPRFVAISLGPNDGIATINGQIVVWGWLVPNLLKWGVAVAWMRWQFLPGNLLC